MLARGDDVVPIPGTKRRTYLEENAAAVDVELTEDDLARIEEAFPKGATAGDRYADMSTIDGKPDLEGRAPDEHQQPRARGGGVLGVRLGF